MIYVPIDCPRDIVYRGVYIYTKSFIYTHKYMVFIPNLILTVNSTLFSKLYSLELYSI